MTLQDIENSVRFNTFLVNSPKHRLVNVRMNLQNAAGYDVMPRDLLRLLVNDAIVHVQAETNEKAQIKHDSFTLNSSVFALPTDWLAIQKIEVFDDANTTGASNAVTSYSPGEGHTLQKVGSIEALRVGVSDDAGQPEKFMLWQQGTTHYIQLDRECDAAYFFDIYYFTTMTTLSSASSTPDLNSLWHMVVENYAAAEVARKLGDFQGAVAYETAYERKKAARLGIIERRRAPGMVVYRAMP